MILLCLICVVVAVTLLVSPPPDREVARKLGASPPASRTHQPSWSRLMLILAVPTVAVGLWLAHRVVGLRGVAVGLALLIAAATCLRLFSQHLQARAASKARGDVAHGCSVLAAQIRVGRVPAEALRSAAEDCPVLAVASLAQSVGGDVTEIWRTRAALPGHAGLADLARAWRVSTETGAPLANALEQVSEALTADQALRMVVAGELAAPRATGKIMAVLPFCGLGLGYLIGGDPLSFLLSTHSGWVCLVSGVALAAAGVLWIDRLAQQAAEQV